MWGSLSRWHHSPAQSSLGRHPPLKAEEHCTAAAFPLLEELEQSGWTGTRPAPAGRAVPPSTPQSSLGRKSTDTGKERGTRAALSLSSFSLELCRYSPCSSCLTISQLAAGTGECYGRTENEKSCQFWWPLSRAPLARCDTEENMKEVFQNCMTNEGWQSRWGVMSQCCTGQDAQGRGRL